MSEPQNTIQSDDFGEIVIHVADADVVLDDSLRAMYSEWVEDRAEALRSKFMVLRPGQVMEYEVKADEASRYYALTEEERAAAPSGLFPFAEEDAEDDGVPVSVVMAAIAAARWNWEIIGKKISTGRKNAKRIVKYAQTKVEIDQSLVLLDAVGAEIEVILGG